MLAKAVKTNGSRGAGEGSGIGEAREAALHESRKRVVTRLVEVLAVDFAQLAVEREILPSRRRRRAWLECA